MYLVSEFLQKNVIKVLIKLIGLLTVGVAQGRATYCGRTYVTEFPKT